MQLWFWVLKGGEIPVPVQDAVSHALKLGVELRCAAPLFIAEVSIAGRKCETVRGPDRLAADDFDRHRELGDHVAQHHQLLVVLLAKQGDVGLDDLKELHDDRRDAAEVTGSKLTFEDFHLLGGRLDVVGLGCRVHLALVRCKEDRNAGILELGSVVGKRARVALEIFRRAELQTVDEDGSGNLRAMLVGGTDQGYVPFVEIAHGRDEGHATEAWAQGPKI